MRELLGEFRDAGGDAIEVVSSSHTLEQYAEYARYARVFGLLASCGSDYHGPGESWARPGRHAAAAGRPHARCGQMVTDPGMSRQSPLKHATGDVFFVSDRTGITAEMLGNSLLSQFEGVSFQRADDPVRRHAGEDRRGGPPDRRDRRGAKARRPIVFSSIVDEAMSAQLGAKPTRCCSTCSRSSSRRSRPSSAPRSSHAAGRSHGIANSHEYFARMEAINFAQAHDDGATTRELAKAQVILIGVSRCGKTPTALYLALQFGILTANFPLTPDDFVDKKLPRVDRAVPRQAVRPDHRSRAAAADPRGAPPGEQVRVARQLPLRSAPSRSC